MGPEGLIDGRSLRSAGPSASFDHVAGREIHRGWCWTCRTLERVRRAGAGHAEETMGYNIYIKILSPPCGPLPSFPSMGLSDWFRDRIASLLSGGFSKITASQHCVHSALWNLLPPFSLVYWHLDS